MSIAADYELLKRIKETNDTFLREWDIEECIGRGSFSSVFRIVKRTGENCLYSALKLTEIDSCYMNQYRSEISALSALSGQRDVVRIEDFSEVTVDDDGYERKFVIMRMGLLNPLSDKGLSEAEVIKLGLQISEALIGCHTHEPHIFHRDIKPDNILVSDDGDYKLSGFSVSILSDAALLENSGMHGTPFFMSPEMHNFIGYDARSDLYSLGVTMYTLLNGGNAPFYDAAVGNLEGAQTAMRRRLDGEKFPVIEGVDSRLMDIIYKLCEPSPDDRYQTAQELHDALAGLR